MRLKNMILTGLALFMGGSLGAPAWLGATGDTHTLLSPARYPERYTIIRELSGTVKGIDPQEGDLFVEDMKGHRWGLSIDEFTTFSKTDAQSLTLKDLKVGDPVYLYFTTWNSRALHVDRLVTNLRDVIGAP
jgi:hypothetical protein